MACLFQLPRITSQTGSQPTTESPPPPTGQPNEGSGLYACSVVKSRRTATVPTSLSNSSVEAWQSYYRGSQFSEFLGSGEASFIRLREPDALYDLTVDLNELNGAISAFKDDYVSLKHCSKLLAIWMTLNKKCFCPDLGVRTRSQCRFLYQIDQRSDASPVFFQQY